MLQNQSCRLLFCFSLWLAQTTSAAAGPIVPPDTGRLALWPRVEWLPDSQNQYAPQEVFMLDSGRFRRPAAAQWDLSRSYAHYVRLHVASGHGGPYYLYVTKWVERFAVYHPDGSCLKTGGDTPLSEHPFTEEISLLPLPPGWLDTTLVLRIANTVGRFEYPVNAGLGLYLLDRASAAEVIEARREFAGTRRLAEVFFLSILFGLLLILLIQYLQTRDRGYLAYVGYVGAIFVYYLLRRIQYFPATGLYLPTSQRFVFEPLWIFVASISYIYFLRVFLEVDSTPSGARIDAVLRGFERVGWVLLLLSGTLLLTLGVSPANGVIIYLRLAYCLTLLYPTYLIFQQRSTLSRYIITGGLVLVLSLLLSYANYYLLGRTEGRINIKPGGLSFFQVGVLMELLIFWAGLGYREKLRTQQTLRLERERHELAQQLSDLEMAQRGVLTEAQRLKAELAELRNQQPDRPIVLTGRTEQLVFPLNRISYFTAEERYANVILTDGTKHFLNQSLQRLVEEHEPDIVRIHRSLAVNLRQVRRLRPGPWGTALLDLPNGETLTVGRTYRAEVTAKLEQLG